MKPNICSLKINHTDKPVARLMKKKREKTQIIKIKKRVGTLLMIL